MLYYALFNSLKIHDCNQLRMFLFLKIKFHTEDKIISNKILYSRYICRLMLFALATVKGNYIHIVIYFKNEIIS